MARSKHQRAGPGEGETLPWTDAHALEWSELLAAYRDHVNPGFLKILRALGHDRTRLLSANGMYYKDADGRKILDLFGGFGSLNLGHNHPRLVRARRAFDETDQVEICHAFVPTHATVLARNLAAILPGDLEVCHFCCSGSEAIEGALKLAVKHAGNPRGRIVYAERGMHGKTHGALSVTGWPPFQRPFKLVPDCQPVPFGDAAAIARVLETSGRTGSRGQVVAVVLEPIQSGAGVVVPPEGYLREVARLCREAGVLLLMDEVQTGFGRTGAMFAFEHEGIVPDVLALSKSMGGGKAPIGAFVARRPVFAKAFGGARDSILHNSTFGGMGGACALATETINVLLEEGLVDNAATTGRYFLDRLQDLTVRYPELIADVRGRGLLIGVELRDLLDLLTGSLAGHLPLARNLGSGALAALVAGNLLFDHGVLVAFTEFDRNVLRIEPPLIITEAEVDRAVAALDAVLGRGVAGLVKSSVGARLVAD